MSERGLTTDVINALNARFVEQIIFVEMQLDSGTLRITSTPFNVTWNGHNWLSTHGLGSMELIKESTSEISGTAFTLSGVPISLLSTILSERLFKRKVIVRVANIVAGVLHVDPNVWTGELDMPQIQAGPQTLTIRVTAEHKTIAWQNPQPVVFSDADHRLDHPTDTFFSRMSEMTKKHLVWPRKEYFQQ